MKYVFSFVMRYIVAHAFMIAFMSLTHQDITANFLIGFEAITFLYQGFMVQREYRKDHQYEIPFHNTKRKADWHSVQGDVEVEYEQPKRKRKNSDPR